MAASVYNRSKGRFTEFAERINANDPANSVFKARFMASSGLESHATLIDKDDWTDVVSGTTDWATNTNATTPKTLDNTSGITITYSDASDRTEVDVPDQTWTAVANDGTGAIGALDFGYDSDSGAGTDANILTGTHHDFAVTPDGSDITAQIASTGIFNAT